jgi:HlyD family secretion protein
LSTNPASWSDAIAEPPRIGALRRWKWPILGGFVLLAVAATALSLRSSTPTDRWAETPIFRIKRGPLTISVVEPGNARSSQAVTLRNEVAGKTTILRLVEEGAHVKTGDLLVELNSADLRDKKVDQDIVVQNTQAAYVSAHEALEVAKKEAQANIQAAEVALRLAHLDLKKFLDGEYKQTLDTAKSKITLADAGVRQTTEKLQWSAKLAKEGYITSTELETDQLAEQKAQLDLQLAKGELSLLEKFTYERTVAELTADADQKEFLVVKAKHKANSSIVEAEAAQRAKELTLTREKGKLEKVNDQIAKCKIVAPVDGMVVYATSSGGGYRGGSDTPLAEGVDVREMQELIRLPTTAQMLADVKIHESVLEKVTIGMPARVTTEALPGRTFAGSIRKIAPIPDSQNSWLNPDLKVFNTEIEIDGDTSELRPGMSCRAEIIVSELNDALYAPLQCVTRVGDIPTVYVAGDLGPEARPVKLGLDDGRMVQVLSGVRENEPVLLAPPLPPAVRHSVPTRAKMEAASRKGDKAAKAEAAAHPPSPPAAPKPLKP